MRTQADRAARKYLRRAVVEARRDQVPLVLLGSYARRTSTSNVSDVDVLVLDGRRLGPTPEAVHVVRLSKEQLVHRVRRGDDFTQWALRYGVPLTCRKEWSQLADQLLVDAPWPRTERKLEQLGHRLAVAEDLLGMGDVDAAREESGSALNLVSRAGLLGVGHFPLSTPELPEQLRKVGERELAQAIDAFRSGGITTKAEVGELIGLIRWKAADLGAASRSDEGVKTRSVSNTASNEPRRIEPDDAGRAEAESVRDLHQQGRRRTRRDGKRRRPSGS
jgi:predicted nucleotidyltransferase